MDFNYSSKSMRLLAAFLLLFMLFACKAKSRLRSKEQFAALLAEDLKKANPGLDLVLNTDGTITVKKDGAEKRYSLESSYKAYRDNPPMLEELLEIDVAAISDLILKRNISTEDIIPLIEPASYVGDPKFAKGDRDNLIFERYNEQLILVYAEVHENLVRDLTKERFNLLGVSMDSLKKVSLQNLDKIVPLISREGENGSYKITTNLNLNASLILLHSFWTKETFPVDGDFVIAIPSNTQILVTGSNNEAEVARLRRIALNGVDRSEETISYELFKWNGNKFEMYK